MPVSRPAFSLNLDVKNNLYQMRLLLGTGEASAHSVESLTPPGQYLALLFSASRLKTLYECNFTGVEYLAERVAHRELSVTANKSRLG